MKTEAQIYKSLFDWFKRESGLTVIKANQGTPRPARPYASLRYLSASDRLGGSQDQQRSSLITVNSVEVSGVVVEGMRKAVASLNIFGENALSTLAKVRDSLDRPDVIEEFIRAEIGHIEEGPINDLTDLEETEYLERGQMDLMISFVASSEVDVGTIEHVGLDGEINGHVALVEVEIP